MNISSIMNIFRGWLFRGLVIGAVGLMLKSWFMVWWRCWVIGAGYYIQIRPWGLDHNVSAEYFGFLEGVAMPAWFAPLIWTYLGVCISLLLFSLFVKEKVFSLGKFRLSLPQMLIGGVGLSYIIIVVLALIVAAIRTGDFYGVHLIGETYITLGGWLEGDVEASLLFGYWLACGVGPLLIVLAILRNKIIGKPKLMPKTISNQ